MYFGLMLGTFVVCGSKAVFTPASIHRDCDLDGEISSKFKTTKINQMLRTDLG